MKYLLGFILSKVSTIIANVLSQNLELNCAILRRFTFLLSVHVCALAGKHGNMVLTSIRSHYPLGKVTIHN